MKDAMMHKFSPVPSCLADSAEADASSPDQTAASTPASPEGGYRLKLSAATIGLAISMSTTGILLAGQSKAVLAANSPTSEAKLLEMAAENSENPSTTANNKLISPALKHEVKQGESLWQISEEYQVSPFAIAAANNLNPHAPLEVGQSLKIPSVEAAVPPNKEVADSQPAARQSNSLATPLENLREARRRLQQSMAVLSAETEPTGSKGKPAAIEVSDASLASQAQPVESDRNLTALSSDASQPQSIEIPVPRPETEQESATLNRPIPIAVPSTTTAVNPVAPLPASKTYPAVGTSNSVLPAKAQTVAPAELPRPLPLSPTAAVFPEPPTSEGVELPAAAGWVIPEPPSAAPAANVYRVQVGDTLNSIARRHRMSVAQLMRVNNLTNPNLIKVNQSLVVSRQPVGTATNSRIAPPAGLPVAAVSSAKGTELPVETYQANLKADIKQLQQTYQGQPNAIPLNVQPAPLTSQAAAPQSVNTEWASDRRPTTAMAKPQLISAANAEPQEYNSSLRFPAGQVVSPELPPLSPPQQYLPDTPMQFTGYIWPAKGVLTSGYGWRWGRMHKGVDIAAPIGTPVMAAAAGEVVSAGWNSGGYGNLVKLQHADGSVTLYAHNSRILVRPGQRVEQGELISEMGSTGFSTGPHLHFEVHPGGQGAVNPIAFLPSRSR